MTDLEFYATFGDRRAYVRITQPPGASGAFHLFIDNYFQGQLSKENGEWILRNSTFSPDDVQAIGERIDSHLENS